MLQQIAELIYTFSFSEILCKHTLISAKMFLMFKVNYMGSVNEQDLSVKILDIDEHT